MSRKKGLVALSALFLVMLITPALALAAPAQDTIEVATGPDDVKMWIAIISAASMAVASSMCGMAQGRAVMAACEGMARNPSAGGQIRGSLIIGLVLIESLAIYSLLIGLVLLFLKWGT